MNLQKFTLSCCLLLIQSLSFAQWPTRENVTVSLMVDGEKKKAICQDVRIEIHHRGGRIEELELKDCKGKSPKIKGEESVELRFYWGDYRMIFPEIPADWLSYKKRCFGNSESCIRLCRIHAFPIKKTYCVWNTLVSAQPKARHLKL